MAASFMGTLLMIAAGLFAFFIFLVVCLFVGFGALKLLKNKRQLAQIDISDGLDAAEMEIIRNAIFAKKKAEKETKVKTEAVEALKAK